MLVPAVSRPARRGPSPLVTVTAGACFLATIGLIAALVLGPKHTTVNVVVPAESATPRPTIVIPATKVFAQPVR